MNDDSSYDTPAGASSARLLARALEVVIGLILVALLPDVGAVWATQGQPFNPKQESAVAAVLDSDTQRAAARLPEHPQHVIALTYHSVSDGDSAKTTVNRQDFAVQMAALAAAGYQTIRLGDVNRLVGRQPVGLPAKPLLLTFDEGSLTDWTIIDPVLKRHGFTAVAFLTTGRIVAPGTVSRYLSTRNVQALAKTGRWEFGSHTASLQSYVGARGEAQTALTSLQLPGGGTEPIAQWRERVRVDLAASQAFFQRVLGSPVTAFSYPHGDAGIGTAVGTELPSLLADAGFGLAFVGEHVPKGHVDAIGSDTPRMLLPRIGIHPDTSVHAMLDMIQGAIPSWPPADLTTLRWYGDLATCAVQNHSPISLTVSGKGSGLCSLGNLNTTRWTDCTVRTRVIGVDRHANATIRVREGLGTSHRGQLTVHIGESSVSLRVRAGGAPELVLARRPVPVKAARDITISLKGNHVSVQVDRVTLFSLDFDSRLPNGGVSFGILSATQRSVVFSSPQVSCDSTDLARAPAGE